MGNNSAENAGKLQVYVMNSHWPGLPTMSPFGLKLLTWLSLAGVPHEVCHEPNPGKGPKKKSPWVVDGGRALGDSELIIEHLSRTRGVDPDAHLSPREQALGLALRRTFEEHFHQILEHGLFVLDEGWAESRSHFDFLPAPVRPLVVKLIRGEIRKAAYVRGIGRHSLEEIAAMADADLRAADELLGDQAYFLGDRPTLTDCSVYGSLAIILWSPIDHHAQRSLRRYPRLVAFCERMRDRCQGTGPVALVA